MVCAFLPSAFTRKAENQEYSRFYQGSDRISAGMQSNGIHSMDLPNNEYKNSFGNRTVSLLEMSQNSEHVLIGNGACTSLYRTRITSIHKEC